MLTSASPAMQHHDSLSWHADKCNSCHAAPWALDWHGDECASCLAAPREPSAATPCCGQAAHLCIHCYLWLVVLLQGLAGERWPAWACTVDVCANQHLTRLVQPLLVTDRRPACALIITTCALQRLVILSRHQPAGGRPAEVASLHYQPYSGLVHGAALLCSVADGTVCVLRAPDAAVSHSF